MSKLSTLLRRVARAEPAPMGFAAIAGRTKNPEMAVGVGIQKLDAGAAKSSVEGGADFLLLLDGDLATDVNKIKAITGAVSVPVGLRVAKAASDSTGAARDAGLDYLRIEDDEASAAVLLDDEMGFVLSVADDAGDTFLRILESMPFDALLVDEIQAPITIRHQIDLRRLSGLAHKPLLLRLSESLTAPELETLRDSGVAAVMLEGDAAGRLAALRESVQAMSPRRRRREDRQGATPVLPSVAHGGADEDDEDE